MVDEPEVLQGGAGFATAAETAAAAAPPKASEIPKQSDGSVLFYFLDAAEQNGTVYLFGKVKDGDVYRSCCVRVPDLCRNLSSLLHCKQG